MFQEQPAPPILSTVLPSESPDDHILTFEIFFTHTRSFPCARLRSPLESGDEPENEAREGTAAGARRRDAAERREQRRPEQQQDAPRGHVLLWTANGKGE